jgi:hypothetical protein
MLLAAKPERASNKCDCALTPASRASDAGSSVHRKWLAARSKHHVEPPLADVSSQAKSLVENPLPQSDCHMAVDSWRRLAGSR